MRKEKAPSISPIRGSAQLGFSDKSDWSDLSDLSDPSEPHADSCSFAPFVNIRGLKTSIEFPLFSFQEAHKAAHERERANNFLFSRANTIRLLVDFLMASADSIRGPADSIRKSASAIRLLTEMIRRFFIKNDRKR